MANSRDYWKQRFEQVEQSQNRQGVQCMADIEKQYRQAQKQIEGQIAAWYQRFADNNKITLAETHRLLNTKELAEFKWDVNRYIQYGQENAINGTWVKQLENASARFHINRLEALKMQTQQSLEVLFGNQLDTIDSAMKGIYTNGYYRTAFEIQKGVGVGWDFATLDDKQIAKVINKPWAADGKNFSERVWSNRQKLVNELNTTLTQNIILGKDPQKAIDEIARKMNTSKVNAGRLVMTEEAAFSSAAQKDCFAELDVEQYEIVATLDSHTSDICQEMDGKHFPMTQWEVGTTAPPFHVWCRSTTVPFFDDEFDVVGERAAKNEKGETYYVPADTTYKDWKKAFVDGDKTDLQPVQSGDTIKTEEQSKTTPVQDVIPPELQASKDYYSTWNQSRVKDFAQQHLNNIGLGSFKVQMRNTKSCNGCCRGFLQEGQPIQYTDYLLRSTDARNMQYKVKTALHESYHLKSNGLVTDRPQSFKVSGYSQKDWTKWEETFTECSAQYMAKEIGITNISPSYGNYLIETLPKLKSAVPEFAQCSTIADFGKVAYKYRFGKVNEVTASWESIYLQTKGVQHDVFDYAVQYIPYIKSHKDDLIGLVHGQMVSGNWSRDNIEQPLNSILDRFDNLASGQKLSVSGRNEEIVFQNILINAMNLEGVK